MGYVRIRRDRPSLLTQAISAAYPLPGNNFHPQQSLPREHKGRRKKRKGRPKGRPCNTSAGRSMRAVRHGFRAVAPDIDADEQEQPHHVDEMPIPGSELEAEMLGRGEMPGIGADQADDQED